MYGKTTYSVKEIGLALATRKVNNKRFSSLATIFGLGDKISESGVKTIVNELRKLSFRPTGSNISDIIEAALYTGVAFSDEDFPCFGVKNKKSQKKANHKGIKNLNKVIRVLGKLTGLVPELGAFDKNELALTCIIIGRKLIGLPVSD